MSFDFTQLLFFALWGLVVLFFFAWFFYLYLKKSLITVLSSTVLMKIFIPVIFMYPFAFSEKNIMSTGRIAYNTYLQDVNKAFIISLIGTIFFVIGCYITSKIRSNQPFLNTVSRSYTSLINKKDLTVFLVILTMLALVMYKLGFFQSFFSGRSFAMENSSIRPISNFFYSSCTLFLMLTLTYFYKEKSKVALLYIAIALVFSLSSGTRGAVFNSVLIFVFMYFNIKKRTNFLKIIFGGLFLLIIAIYLGDVRNQQYNLIVSLVNGWDKIFYGNNFSDLRDFAWVLSYWDQKLLYGKSLIAGYLGFVPSSLFPLRSQWGLGEFTVTTIGYDPSIHAGLRPGIFGESYFNFGLLGVCITGFVYGYFINSVNIFVERAIKSTQTKGDIINKVSMGYVLSGVAFYFMVTAGFFNVYVNVVFIVIGYLKYLLRLKYFGPNYVPRPKKKYRITW